MSQHQQQQPAAPGALALFGTPAPRTLHTPGGGTRCLRRPRGRPRPAPPPQSPASTWRSSSASSDAELRLDLDGLSCKAVSSQGTPTSHKEFTIDLQATVCINTRDSKKKKVSVRENNPLAPLHSMNIVPTNIFQSDRSSPINYEKTVMKHHNLLREKCGISTECKSVSPVLNSTGHITNSQTSLVTAGHSVVCIVPMQSSQSQPQNNTKCAIKMKLESEGHIRSKQHPSFQPEKNISLVCNHILDSSNLMTIPYGNHNTLYKNHTQYLSATVIDKQLADPLSDEAGPHTQEKHSGTESNDTHIQTANELMNLVSVNGRENSGHKENFLSLSNSSTQCSKDVSVLNESIFPEFSLISDNSSSSALSKKVTNVKTILSAPICQDTESLLYTGKEVREKSNTEVSSFQKTQCCPDNNIFCQHTVLKCSNKNHSKTKRDLNNGGEILLNVSEPTSLNFEQCQSNQYVAAFGNETLENKLIHGSTKPVTNEITTLYQDYSSASIINGDKLTEMSGHAFKTNISNLHQSNMNSKIKIQPCKSLASSETIVNANLTTDSEVTIQKIEDLKLAIPYSEISDVSYEILPSHTTKTTRAASECLENCEKSHQNCSAIDESKNRITKNVTKPENPFKLVGTKKEVSTQPHNNVVDLCDSTSLKKISFCQQQLSEAIGGRMLVSRYESSEHSHTQGTRLNKNDNSTNLFLHSFHSQDGDVSDSLKLLFDKCEETETTKVIMSCRKLWLDDHITEKECNGFEKPVELCSSYTVITRNDLQTTFCEKQKPSKQFLYYGNDSKLKVNDLESFVNFQNKNYIHLFLLFSTAKVSDEILSCLPDSIIKEMFFHLVKSNEDKKQEVTSTSYENKIISFEMNKFYVVPVHNVPVQERHSQVYHDDGIKQILASNIMYYQLKKGEPRKYFCISKEIFPCGKHLPVNNSWFLVHNSIEEDMKICRMIYFRGHINEFLYSFITTHKFIDSTVDHSGMLFSVLRSSFERLNDSLIPRKLPAGTEVDKSDPMVGVKDGKNNDNADTAIIQLSDIGLLQGSFSACVEQKRVASEDSASQTSPDEQEYLQNNFFSDVCNLLHIIQQKMPTKSLTDAALGSSTSIHLPTRKEEADRKNSESKMGYSETLQFEEENISASTQAKQLCNFNELKCECGCMLNTSQQIEVGYKRTKVDCDTQRYQSSGLKITDFPYGRSTQINCEQSNSHFKMVDTTNSGPNLTCNGSLRRKGDLLINIQESERNLTPESVSSCSLFSYDSEDSENFVVNYISQEKCEQSSQNSQFCVNDSMNHAINDTNCTLCKNSENYKLKGPNFEYQRVFKSQLTDQVNTMSDIITVSADEVQQMAYHARHLAESLEHLLWKSSSSSQMGKNSSELKEFFPQKPSFSNSNSSSQE